MMDGGSVPIDFTYEEERLINEFMVISGTSELSRNSATPTNVTSGVALQLLVDQDDTRLAATSDEMRFAVKECGEMILRLYRQFALTPRTIRAVRKDKIEVMSFTAEDISDDGIVLDTTSEVNDTTSQKRSMMFQLLTAGVLYDSDGKLSEETKKKILRLTGFADWQ